MFAFAVVVAIVKVKQNPFIKGRSKGFYAALRSKANSVLRVRCINNSLWFLFCSLNGMGYDFGDFSYDERYDNKDTQRILYPPFTLGTSHIDILLLVSTFVLSLSLLLFLNKARTCFWLFNNSVQDFLVYLASCQIEKDTESWIVVQGEGGRYDEYTIVTAISLLLCALCRQSRTRIRTVVAFWRGYIHHKKYRNKKNQRQRKYKRMQVKNGSFDVIV